MSMVIKVVIFDLDGTLWDHPDVSSLRLPFRKLDEDLAVDADGVKVRLFSGVRKVLKKLSAEGKILSVASWNRPEPALQLLGIFRLLGFFKYPKIYPHPRKYEMILELLNDLRAKGFDVSPEEVVYIDDRTIHIEDVWRQVGQVKFIHMWKDAKSYAELLRIIRELDSH